jgi:hypothetical protein
MAKQDPPYNGRVYNHWSKPVTVWSDDKLFYTIPAGTDSDPNDDVDHILDVHGRWWKIGPFSVTVDKSGHLWWGVLWGYEWLSRRGACQVSGPGKACGE